MSSPEGQLSPEKHPCKPTTQIPCLLTTQPDTMVSSTPWLLLVTNISKFLILGEDCSSWQVHPCLSKINSTHQIYGCTLSHCLHTVCNRATSEKLHSGLVALFSGWDPKRSLIFVVGRDFVGELSTIHTLAYLGSQKQVRVGPLGFTNWASNLQC